MVHCAAAFENVCCFLTVQHCSLLLSAFPVMCLLCVMRAAMCHCCYSCNFSEFRNGVEMKFVVSKLQKKKIRIIFCCLDLFVLSSFFLLLLAFSVWFCLHLELGSTYIVQTGLKLMILLPLLPGGGYVPAERQNLKYFSMENDRFSWTNNVLLL